MNKLIRLTVRLGLLGLAITGVIVMYQVLTNSYPPRPMSDALFLAIVILCPPSLLSIPIIDAEVGTAAFYVVGAFIGLVNAALYAAIGGAFGYLRYLWKSSRRTTS